jgi:hypothetical protein
VRRVAHVHGADSSPGLAVHTGDRGDCRRVRKAVVDRFVKDLSIGEAP